MSELPITLVEFEQQGLALRRQAAEIQVVDQPSYDLAVNARIETTMWLKEAGLFFDGDIAKAHELHKSLIAKKKIICGPFEEGLKTINMALIQYDNEQERIRLAEQRRLEEEARKEAEEQRIADAIHMENQGASPEVVDAVLSEAVHVDVPVIAERTYEKSSAVTYRDNWNGVCDDLFKLAQAVAKDKSKIGLLMVNQPALNQMAKALKGTMAIPGCRAVNNRVIASSGRAY